MILTSLCRALCQAALFTAVAARSCNSSQIERWGVYEKALKGPSEGNPFVDTTFSATFTQGSVSVSVPGFYDGDGIYRVRFSPPEVGPWTWRSESNAAALVSTGSFYAKEASEDNHGPVSITPDGYHFVHADGTPFRPVGTTSYSWAQQSDEMTNQTLATLKETSFNKMRMLFFNNVKAIWVDPFVLTGPGPKDWDPARYNISYWHQYEKQVVALGKLGIQADVILYNPYGAARGFSDMARTDDERYLRYISARFSAFRHVWWSMGNEYDGIKTKTMEDWDHLFQVLQKADPHNRLRSMHNLNIYYDARKPWITHASIQNGAAPTGDISAYVHRMFALKAVIFDEVLYEGNSSSRWGRLTGEQMVLRYWWATIAGTYVSHSDTYGPVTDLSWLGIGGKILGESAPRLAFLKKILDEAPLPGIEPIESWYEKHMGGKLFEYYIRYFGEEAPTEYDVVLPGRDDDPFVTHKIDIIDTWDMTITPVEGTFKMQLKDRYSHWDPSRPKIKMPGKKWMAVRYQKVA